MKLSLTSLNNIQGTPVREGSRFLVSTPMSWSRLEPWSVSTQALTSSGEVVVMSNISRQTSAESGGESDPIMQFIRGTYSAGSSTCSRRHHSEKPPPVVRTPCLIEKTSLDLVTLTLSRSVLTDEVPTITRLCKLSRWFAVNWRAAVKLNLTFAFPKGLRSTLSISFPKYSQFGYN